MIFRTITITGLVMVALAAGCGKPTADELVASGNAFVEKGQLPEAIVQYRLAAQTEPSRGDLRTKLAEAYLANRDLSAALRETVMAADLLPNDVDAQVKAGSLLLLAGAFEDAKGRAEKALTMNPKHVGGLVLMGNALAGLKDLDGALNEYQEAIALDPAADQIYANIGAIQYRRGQKSEAEATFRKAVDVAPKSLAARLALGSFLWASARLPEAESALQDALALEPANLGANRALGAFYMATNRAALAEPYFKTLAATARTEAAELALADYYLARGRPDDAKAILTPLSEKPDSFGPALLRLAGIEASQNNRAGAGSLIQAVLAKTPKYAPARVLNMRLLLGDGKLDEAMAAATALNQDESGTPAASEAYFVIGSIETRRDRTEEAIKAYDEALRIQPRSLPIAMALAQLHLRLGNADKAETHARQVLAALPADLAARAIVIRADLMRNNLQRAGSALAALEKEAPNVAPVLNLVGARELAGGRIDAARAAFTKAAALAPDDLEALEGLVVTELRTGRGPDAIGRIDAALKRMPASAGLFVIAARAYATTGDQARAEELLKQAIEREPARLAAYGLLGQLYVGQNRLPDARAQFTQLLAKNPSSVAANTMLAMILEAQRDLPAAEQQYLKTLAVDPGAAVAANNLAWIYVASNRNLDQALQLAQAALKSLPEEPHVNDTAGWIYYRKGMFPAAIRHLEISVKRDASDPTVHYHLGMAYVQAGELDKGRQSLRKALSMSSTFDGAEEARKTLGGLAGKIEP